MSKTVKQVRQFTIRMSLNRDYQNVNHVNEYKLTAKDGFSIIYKLNLTTDFKELLNHADITIGGIPIKKQAPSILAFTCSDQETALKLYREKIKPELLIKGYKVLKHECEKSIENKVEHTRDCCDISLFAFTEGVPV